jgi:hypothetical protein
MANISEMRLRIVRFQTMLRVRRHRAHRRIQNLEYIKELVLEDLATASPEDQPELNAELAGVEWEIIWQEMDFCFVMPVPSVRGVA